MMRLLHDATGGLGYDVTTMVDRIIRKRASEWERALVEYFGTATPTNEQLEQYHIVTWDMSLGYTPTDTGEMVVSLPNYPPRASALFKKPAERLVNKTTEKPIPTRQAKDVRLQKLLTRVQAELERE